MAQPKLIDYFDRTKIINLKYRPDRRRMICRDFAKHGIQIGTGKVEYFDAVRPVDDGGFETMGMHGCFLSHLGILREARAAGLSRILHVEDDLQLSRKFDEYQEQLADQLAGRPWDIVYLGHDVAIDPTTPAPSLSQRSPDERIDLAHFVGINGPIIGRLVDFLEGLLTRPPGDPKGGPMPPDGALSVFRSLNRDVVTLLANPSLGRQRGTRNDAHPLRWFDQTPVVRDLAEAARRFRNHFRPDR